MTWSRATATAGSAAVTLACCRIRIVCGHRETPRDCGTRWKSDISHSPSGRGKAEGHLTEARMTCPQCFAPQYPTANARGPTHPHSRRRDRWPRGNLPFARCEVRHPDGPPAYGDVARYSVRVSGTEIEVEV